MNWPSFRSRLLQTQQNKYPRVLDQCRLHILFDLYCFAFCFFLSVLTACFIHSFSPWPALFGLVHSASSLWLLIKKPFRKSLLLFTTGLFFLQFSLHPLQGAGQVIFLVTGTIFISIVISIHMKPPWGPFYLWTSFFAWIALNIHNEHAFLETFLWLLATLSVATLGMHLMNSLFLNFKLQETIMRHALDRQKELNKELESFTYSASHDLQEPLRKIISFVDLMNQKFSEKLDPKAQTYLYFIDDAAQRMKLLIKNLLEYSRTGKTALNPTHFSLLHLTQSVCRQTLPKEEVSRVRFEIDQDFFGDYIQMERLLQNMIENAWKYRKQDVPFSLEIKTFKKNKNLILSLQDNGIGIAPQFHQQVFELFQRLHPPEGIKGSGIGLATCKKIAEMHQGRIQLFSIPGEGSTFTISFPQPLHF